MPILKPRLSRRGEFTLKGIGDVEVKVPIDRKGEFITQVMLRSKQYEEEIRRDLSFDVPNRDKHM